MTEELAKKLAEPFRAAYPLLCDDGPNAGLYRLRTSQPIYLTAAEVEELQEVHTACQ